jgi:hypothetical protein
LISERCLFLHIGKVISQTFDTSNLALLTSGTKGFIHRKIFKVDSIQNIHEIISFKVLHSFCSSHVRRDSCWALIGRADATLLLALQTKLGSPVKENLIILALRQN